MNSYRDIKLWYLLRHTLEALHKVRYKELSQYDITVPQSWILYFINELDEKANITEIARCMSRHPNTISRQVKKLEDKELIKKQFKRSENTIIFSLTRKGEANYKHTIEYKSIHIAMSSLTDLERKRLELYLSKIWEDTTSQLRQVSQSLTV